MLDAASTAARALAEITPSSPLVVVVVVAGISPDSSPSTIHQHPAKHRLYARAQNRGAQSVRFNSDNKAHTK